MPIKIIKLVVTVGNWFSVLLENFRNKERTCILVSSYPQWIEMLQYLSTNFQKSLVKRFFLDQGNMIQTHLQSDLCLIDQISKVRKGPEINQGRIWHLHGLMYMKMIKVRAAFISICSPHQLYSILSLIIQGIC